MAARRAFLAKQVTLVPRDVLRLGFHLIRIATPFFRVPCVYRGRSPRRNGH